jgi:hypothetical protein
MNAVTTLLDAVTLLKYKNPNTETMRHDMRCALNETPYLSSILAKCL